LGLSLRSPADGALAATQLGTVSLPPLAHVAVAVRGRVYTEAKRDYLAAVVAEEAIVDSPLADCLMSGRC
jgi:hypothetical protein